jgi:hypothetical protein
MEITFFILGSLGLTIVPTVHSVWTETRFSRKSQLQLGGIGSILFAIIYVTNTDFPSSFEYLKVWAGVIFVCLGIASLIVGYKIKKPEKWWTLFFSKRQFGALGLVFLYPMILEELPPKIISLDIPIMIEFGIILLGGVNIASLIILVMRKMK